MTDLLSQSPNLALLAGAVVVDELAALGVTDVVACPGSRSAPLVYAAYAAEQAGQLRLWMRVDERSAAYFALGLAKATGRAVAVVTTSGTAVANLAPALLEARHAHVPLLAVTADRPATLVGTGANQTTDQVGLLAAVVQRVFRLASADAAPQAWRSAIRRAVVTAEGRLSRTPGPVHVNVELTPPLVGDPGPLPPGTPFQADPVGEARSVALDSGPRTVVVAGDLPVDQGRRWADQAARAGVPLLAEPSSNARCGPSAVRYYRLLLPHLAKGIERVVVVGHPTLSRSVTALLGRRDIEIVAVAPTADWSDPGWAVSRVVPALSLPVGDPAWLVRWQRADRALADAIDRADAELAAPILAPQRSDARTSSRTVERPDGTGRALPGAAERFDGVVRTPSRTVERPDGTSRTLSRTAERSDGGVAPAGADQPLTGPRLAAAVNASLGPDAALVLGSSQLIRDADLAPIAAQPPSTYANRGLAGIDGTIATALGVAVGTQRPTTALIGDLTALHDIGALAQPTLERPIDLRLVIADDGGGGIFATLEYGAPAAEIGELAAAFERCFAVPPGVDLLALARAFGGRAERVATLGELTRALAGPATGRHVIVATLDRTDRRTEAARLARLARQVTG
jgi:2-succinyl-5-enolpyruvyl-6-hydroxy-3-cyclohexene-1-carboxylate synthase